MPTYLALIFVKSFICIFSPITPVCSRSFSSIVILSRLDFNNSSLELQFNPTSAIWCAKSIKSAFLPTKSVSHARTIPTADVLSSFEIAIATPSEDSLSALLAATFCPFFLKISIADSKSPLASTRAFLP